VVSTLAGGTRQLRDLLGQLTRWRVHRVWYLIVIVALAKVTCQGQTNRAT